MLRQGVLAVIAAVHAKKNSFRVSDSGFHCQQGLLPCGPPCRWIKHAAPTVDVSRDARSKVVEADVYSLYSTCYPAMICVRCMACVH